MKFIESKVYSDRCVVFIKIKGKTYIGLSMKNPNDPTPFNQFFGCRLAELKAKIRYLKERKKINKYKKAALDSLIKDLSNREEINTFENVLNLISIHQRYYSKEINNIQNEINLIKESIKQDCEKREAIYKKRTDKKE